MRLLIILSAFLLFSQAHAQTIEEQWNQLVFEKGGCLTGGQHVHDGIFGSEGCVMMNEEWEAFFQNDERDLSFFLIGLMADTTETHIHTCPFYSARNGEVAVYALHKIYKINWYDLEPYQEYRDREITSGTDSHQGWLWAILEDEEQCELMKAEWVSRIRMN